jgi:hypothetical protein
MQAVDSKLLMRAALFTSTTKHAANNAYNCSNGDTFRWFDVDEGQWLQSFLRMSRGCNAVTGGMACMCRVDLWPKIAAYFGNEAGALAVSASTDVNS